MSEQARAGVFRSPTVMLVGRTLLLLITLSFVFFGIAHLVPGGICSLYPAQTPAGCRSSLGLNSSPPVQYLRWVGTYLHGNVGRSPDGTDVASKILGGVPGSLLLVLAGLIFYLGVEAMRRLLPSRLTRMASPIRGAAVLLTIALPVMWLAIVLVYALAIHWRVLPAARMDDANVPAFWSDAWFARVQTAPVMMLVNLVKHLILPGLTFAFVFFVADRISGSWAHRFSTDGNRRITATSAANWPLFVSLLMGGLVIVETVFSYAGLGYGLSSSLSGVPADYAMALDLLMFASLVVLLTKFASDWRSLHSLRRRAGA